MNPQVKVKQTEAATVAYAAMKGPYTQILGTFGKLYAWMQAKRYVPVGPPAGVYFTTPAQAPAGELAWELRCPIAGVILPHGPDGDGFGVKVVPGGLVAAAVHKGPFDKLGETYDLLTAWIAQNDYRIAGPSQEVYFSDVAKVPAEELVTEVRFPIRRSK